MSWQPIALTWPASAAAVAAAAAPGVSGTATSTADASARLAAINDVVFTNAPQATGAGGAAAARAALQTLLDAPCWVLSVDPFSAGSGEILQRYLSPANAVNLLSKKLRDSGDPRRPTGALELVCLMVYASSQDAFAQQLAALNTVVPILGFAQRRAEQLADIENSKWLQIPTAQPLHWEKRNLAYQASARECDKNLGDAVALLEGYDAENISPVDELTDVIAQKVAAAAAIDAAVSALANQFSGGAGSGFFASANSLSALAATLSDTAPADHAYTLTAGLCLVGQAGALDFYRELFGL